MPTNLDALLRYHTIDYCLQNHYRKWNWEDLAEACADYFTEVSPRASRNIPSKRTIQQDIKIMRSGDLGYYAPIENANGYYFYTDKNYSIKNATLSKTDLENISVAANVLGQYKGFDFFEDLSGVFGKFESRLQLQLNQHLQENIAFEKAPQVKGTEFLKPLLANINEKQVIAITYQKFGDNENKQHIIHPYLLKEYQDRWYVLGWHPQVKSIKTFALDRIENITFLPNETYIPNSFFKHDHYFNDTIGITYTGDAPEKIIMEIDADFAPYLITKPLHHSQQLLSSNAQVFTFSYYLTINQELENMLMCYANHINVVEPKTLKISLIEKIKKALKNFS